MHNLYIIVHYNNIPTAAFYKITICRYIRTQLLLMIDWIIFLKVRIKKKKVKSNITIKSVPFLFG